MKMCRGGTHRRDLRRAKGPKVSVLASSSSTCMVNSPIRFMALSSSACTGSPLRCLSEASIPPIAFSRARAGRSLRPTGATEVAPARHAKAAERPHACAPPSIAGQVPAGLGKAWPGENVDEPSSPAFTTGPSTATFFSKLSVMFRSSLDTSIKPILCPRKSGPTHVCRREIIPDGLKSVAPVFVRQRRSIQFGRTPSRHPGVHEFRSLW